MESNNKNIRSIREIEISERRKKFDSKKEKRIMKENREGNLFKKILFIVVLLLIILGGISLAFHKAEIKVNPKSSEIIFNNEIYKAVAGINGSENILEKKEKNEYITKGEIKIYNKTNRVQILKKETRFETEDGLIFKIYKKAIIPAGGSIKAEAFSDGKGDKYLKKKGEKLTVPGFKEINSTELYKKITGEISKDFIFDKNNTPAEEKNNENENLNIKGKIGFYLLEIEEKDEREVDYIGVSEINEKTKGIVKIINDTSKTQKLRKTTRFRINDKVYRAVKSVTILANSSAEVEVVADEPGEEYNLNEYNLRMDIPGFKEEGMTYEYNNIYAYNIKGFRNGFVGKKLIPNKEKLDEAKKEAEEEIKNKLLENLNTNEKKKEYIFLEDAQKMIIDFEVKNDNEDKLILVTNGKLILPIIKKADLKEILLKVGEFKSEDIKNISIKNFDNLRVKLLNSNFDILADKEFIFSVNGKINIFWKLDQDAFVNSIRGKKLSDIEDQMMYSFKNFEMEFKIYPFWRKTVPFDKERIEIKINY